MKAGELDKEITIQVNTATRSSSGADVDSWGTHAVVWASVMPKFSGEAEISDRDVSSTLFDFKIRYLSTVLPGMRISWDSRVFNVQGIKHTMEKGDKTILNCRELI